MDCRNRATITPSTNGYTELVPVYYDNMSVMGMMRINTRVELLPGFRNHQNKTLRAVAVGCKVGWVYTENLNQ